MILTTLVMMKYGVKDNTYGLFVGLLGLNEVMGLYVYTVLVDLDWSYE